MNGSSENKKDVNADQYEEVELSDDYPVIGTDNDSSRHPFKFNNEAGKESNIDYRNTDIKSAKHIVGPKQFNKSLALLTVSEALKQVYGMKRVIGMIVSRSEI